MARHMEGGVCEVEMAWKCCEKDVVVRWDWNKKVT